MPAKVSVFCIWRDSEPHIHQTLKQLEDLESLQDFEFSFYFYENDSKDNTFSILSDWISHRKGSVCSEKLDKPKFGRVIDPARMKFLCECRNKCKALAGENKSDYSLLIDSDIQFNKENFLIQLDVLNQYPDAVMVTPNVRQSIPDYTFGLSIDSYYDVYPFRDKHGNGGMYFSDCPSFKADDQFKWKLGLPIRCLSAFGGFALLLSNAFNKVNWSADVHCDHVNMCFDLGIYGSIYCAPKSLVFVDVGIDQINVDAVKASSANQFKYYQNHFLYAH